MNKTQINLIKKIINNSVKSNKEEKRLGYKIDSGEIGFTDGYRVYLFNDDGTIPDEFIYDFDLKNKGQFDIAKADSVKFCIETCLSSKDLIDEIELPDIKELKEFKKRIDNVYKSPYLFKIDCENYYDKFFIMGFNVTFLIDIITLTKATKCYINKEKGSFGIMKIKSEIGTFWILPMRVKTEYAEHFKNCDFNNLKMFDKEV